MATARYVLALMLVAFGAALLITASGVDAQPVATVTVGQG